MKRIFRVYEQNRASITIGYVASQELAVLLINREFKSSIKHTADGRPILREAYCHLEYSCTGGPMIIKLEPIDLIDNKETF